MKFGRRALGVALWCGLAAVLACVAAAPAGAVPDLQVYVQGATYDTATDTWVTDSSDFDLQVIGANDAIQGVKLAAALVGDDEPADGSISLTGVGFTVGTPSAFTYGTPVLGDGSSLPGHGIYPAYFSEVAIGDFTPSYDVQDMVGGGTALGEIKTIHVSISGYQKVHFDVYDHITSGDHLRYISNPNSHDSEGGGDGCVPEPGTLLLLGLGLTGSGAAFWRKRR